MLLLSASLIYKDQPNKKKKKERRITMMIFCLRNVGFLTDKARTPQNLLRTSPEELTITTSHHPSILTFLIYTSFGRCF